MGTISSQSVLPKAQKSLVSMLDCLSCAGFNQAALSKRTPLYPFVVSYVSEETQTVCDVFAARAMYIQLWIGGDVFSDENLGWFLMYPTESFTKLMYNRAQ